VHDQDARGLGAADELVRRQEDGVLVVAGAAVAPEPQKITRWPAVPPTALWMIWRASSRSRLVARPVPELSVWVLA